MKAIIAGISSVCFLLGCKGSSPGHDADFEVRIENQANQPGASSDALALQRSHTDQGYYELVITHSGKGDVKRVDKEKALAVLKIIHSQNLFSMQPRYENFAVLDGTTTHVNLRVGNRKKQIVLRNVQPDRIQPLIKYLASLSRQQSFEWWSAKLREEIHRSSYRQEAIDTLNRYLKVSLGLNADTARCSQLLDFLLDQYDPSLEARTPSGVMSQEEFAKRSPFESLFPVNADGVITGFHLSEDDKYHVRRYMERSGNR